MSEEQSYIYEVQNQEAVIHRCHSYHTRIVLPSSLAGYPVTGLAPYAFSDHMNEADLRGRCVTREPGTLPFAGGNRLREIILPATLRHVGRYCFYNCQNLNALTFDGRLQDWGSGVFTGCHRIRSLSLSVSPDGTSSLREVLSELREEVQTDLLSPDSKKIYARLTFPEFFEDGVENTPARIIETHVHGSGIYYRNCFPGGIFDWREYDSRFPYARAQEDFAVLARLSMGRLRYPFRLGETSKANYEQFIAEYRKDFAKLLIRENEPASLHWLVELLCGADSPLADSNDRESFLKFAIDTAGALGRTEIISGLMDYRHIHFTARTRPQPRRWNL